jgi:hypothetical protein
MLNHFFKNVKITLNYITEVHANIGRRMNVACSPQLASPRLKALEISPTAAMIHHGGSSLEALSQWLLSSGNPELQGLSIL